ncbi:MAG: CPBP family intramembrane glutamic endopeptidase [Myxococcota bacterium]
MVAARRLTPLQALGLTVLAVALSQGLLAGLAALRMLRGAGWEAAARAVTDDPFSLAACALLGFGAATLLGLKRMRPAPLEGLRDVAGRLELEPRPGPVVALATVAGLALQLPLSEIGNLVQEVFPVGVAEQIAHLERVTADGPLEGLGIALAFVVVAPLVEEALFRGVIFPGLAENQLARARAAALGSAVLFAIVHVRPDAVAYAFVAGLILAYVRVRTGSLVPCVALHAANNAVPILFSPAVLRLEGFNVVSETPQHIAAAPLLASVLVAGAALWALGQLEAE